MILISLAIVSLGVPKLLRVLHLPTAEGAADDCDRPHVASARAVVAEIKRSQHQIAEEQG